MPDEMLPPSHVFGQRLRETRRARGMSQATLVEKMTKAGRPLSRPSLLRIENGTRGVSLDEALAFAECLAAVPANLLSPPEGAWLALTDTVGVDAEGLRNWLVTGDAVNAWPATPGEENRAALVAILKDLLGFHAQAFVDAARADDDAGQERAMTAMQETIDRYREALAAIEGRPRPEREPSDDSGAAIYRGMVRGMGSHMRRLDELDESPRAKRGSDG